MVMRSNKILKIITFKRIILALLLCFVVLIIFSGRSLNSNDPVAKITKKGAYYEIAMTGKREYMAHDPISYVFRGSYPSSNSIFVPRVSGVVRGEEIPVNPGYYGYTGNVKFSKNSVKIELYAINTDDNKIENFSWNGVYILEEKK